MARFDRAKNAIKGAKVIRNLTSNLQVFSDSVGRADPDDLYKLRLAGRSTLNLSTNGIGNRSRVAFQLFSLKGLPKQLRAISRTPFSNLTRQQIKKHINILNARSSGRSRTLSLLLDGGTYYVRVYGSQGDNRYRLNASVSSGAIPAPTPAPTPAPPPTPTAPFPSPIWIRQFGTGSNDYAFGTAVDGSGDIYVAGVSTASDAFSGSGFVTKYRKDGTLEWQRALSLSGTTAVADIAVDATGNYYIVGATLNGFNSDGFVVKYNSAGQEQWIREIKSTLLGFSAVDAASSIVLDGNDIYVTGIRQAAPAPFSQGNAFIAKYDSNGNLVSSFGRNGIAEFRQMKTTAASGITVANSTIYITGITDATLSLASNNDVDLTGGDAFVAGFDRVSGNLLWNQTLSSGAETDYARAIAVNGSELYIVGQTGGTLPSGSLAANTYGGGEADGFIAKYILTNGGGSLQWVKQVGGTGLDSAQAVTIDSTGRIYWTGETDTGLFSNAVGGSDAWLAQINSDGSLTRTAQLGTPQDDEAYAIVTDSSGTLYVSGQTQGTFPTSGSQNQGNYDVWLAKYI
ncbi:hypothetical protein HJG54_16675 [Leptolyngbya sp. NK1-12]|uniref:Beta-propeller repeat protein n=1 Tax=Leptolyngbya sp. NK1-12 TaxID=2547451 RepID=A0AA97AGH2_9CYAN|nr:hypothetical protein HJG54_16675 [Leptolyngbya sp. NK1-12]